MKKEFLSARMRTVTFSRAAFFCVFSILAMSASVHSQGIVLPENTDLLFVRDTIHYSNTHAEPHDYDDSLWHADSIYLGASFLRDTSKTFRVWLEKNEAGWTGTLYIIIPNGKNNGSGDTAESLFTNKSAVGTSVTLSNIPAVQTHIHDLDTVFFMYVVKSTGGTPASYAGYSGPNRRMGDGFLGVDKYSANENDTGIILTGPLGKFRVGRRYCAAGWIRNASGRTDTVEFAFEDNHSAPGDGSSIPIGNSDFDFNDIVFHVTGLFLIRPPSKLQISAYPPTDTVHAGDTVHMYGLITDNSGKPRPDLGTKISWTLSPSNIGSYITLQHPLQITDSSSTFHAVAAYQWYTIYATYVDSTTQLKDSIRVYVLPGAPASLTIEQSPNIMTRLSASQARMGTTTLSSGMLYDSVYAVLRDAFGNWDGDALTATWSSRDPAIASVQAGNASIGQGVITRQTANNAFTFVRASQNGMKDSVQVNLNNVSYSKINIVVRDSVRDSITSLQMRTDQDTALFAWGLRGDGSGIWDRLQVTWTKSAGLSVSGSAPPSSNTWAILPSAVGTGTISISYGALHDAINVTFTYGLPRSLLLYPQTGTPNVGSNVPYPQSVNVTAGQPLPLVAKLFAQNNDWLSSYELSTAPFTWTLTELTPGAHNSGSLQTTTGAMTSFTGIKAPNIVKIAATFYDATLGLLPITDSIYIRIVPATPAKLVIEKDTTGRYNDSTFTRRAGSVTIGGTATADSVFAVLRDQYGNFVSFSTSTSWLSRDTTQVKVSNGITAYGEGVNLRETNLGQAWVVAQDGNYPSLQDSVLVNLSNISYTALRIVVRDSTIISNLSMTIDQDTLLKVQGLRSDGTGWDNIPATWAISNNLQTAPSIQGSSNTIRFTPTDTGSGLITAALNGATPASVSVKFSHGNPKYIILYAADGDPKTLQAYPAPAVAIIDSAGSAIPVVGKVFDNAGIWLSSYETASTSAITWDTIEFASNKSKPTGSLSPKTGYRTAFTPTKAFNSVYVVGTFSEAGLVYKDTIQVQVAPGAAKQLVIEAKPDSSISPNAAARLGSITMSNITQLDSVYAVLRDAYGNFVSDAMLSQWVSRNAGVVSAQKGDSLRGQGIVTRQTLTAANTFVVATQGAMKDSVQVGLDMVGYSKIIIVTQSAGNLGIDSLKMRTDQDTTLYARGLRADGSGTWDAVTVAWGTTAGMTFSNVPKDSSAWTFSPTAPDTGIIYIVLGALRDTIAAVFSYGNPQTMKLYPASGQPDVGSNTPYPDTVTVVAGQPLPLWAKLFSQSSQWLKGYERSGAPFTWKIDELTGSQSSGSLDNYSANSQTTFTGYKAYQRVKVTGTFSENGIALTRAIVVAITPAAAARLYIEPDTTGRLAYPNVPHRAGQVTMLSTDTTLSVYAVLRDAYGNFVTYSNPTSWQSRDTTQAGVKNGAVAIGEGILIRKIDLGQTVVVATDGKNTSFTDSVVVVLSNISYTKLRIVTGDSTKITSLTLTLDQSQELKVQGLRSDGAGWEYVQAKWGITGTVTTTTNPPGSSINWIVVPADTGSGTIKVSLGNAASDSIPVHFTFGAPKSIVLYPAEGDPHAMQPYPDPGIAVTDSAGKALLVVAKVFDKAGNWLSSLESSIAPVTWSIVELAGNTDVPTGTIIPGTGDKTTLTATKAYNSILIIAEFKQAGQTFDDSIKVTVVPASPYHLVIENSSDRNQSPHKDDPVDTVQIPSSQTYALVFAILRDVYGNYIDVSHNTAWLSLDSAVVTAANGGTQGQGQITRIPSAPRDRAQVTATSLDYPGLRDTTTVVALQYYYLALRIVDPQGDSIGSLIMNTNQDTTLYVQGLRSDNGLWVSASAQWQSSVGLSIVPAAPPNAPSWTFSPDKPGAGTIRVISLNNDTVTTKPAHISVTFLVGPPTAVQIQILTPPDSLIAGDTIVSVVKITNKDGAVPDTFCTSSAYNNSLGGVPGHDPIVIADTTVKMTQSMHECFIGGVDTVRYVLYRAPMGTDSLDKITVALNGLSATTDPFLMHPGELTRIAIEDASGKNLDSVKLAYPTGSELFLSIGYDAYGNERGPENSTWKTDSTLHPVTNAVDVSRVFYQANQSRYDEAGHIIATATGKDGKLITDSAYVSIKGAQTNLISAITQDSSGNGYLDHIVIRFDKLVTITKEYPADSIVITATGDDGRKYTLTVDSISGRSSSTDSVFIIYLAEPKQGDVSYGQPETDWTPQITMPALPGVSPVNNFVSTDRAGPVVWSVVKTVSASTPSTRSSDLVTVTFSEPITTDGNLFNTQLAPSRILHVWIRQTTADGRDTMVEIDTLLAGIANFFQLGNNNTTLSFYMSNSLDLTSRDYISLTTDSTGKSFADNGTPPNVPILDNQKVEVVVSSEPPKEIKVAPNPSSAIFTHQRPGSMDLAYNPYARDWVRQDGAGVVLTFKVVPLIDPVTHKVQRVTGVLKIFDMIGNVVFSLDSSSSKNGIFPPQWGTADTSTFDFDMYWNGSNARGMKVAPGIYRTMLFLKYENVATLKRYNGTVGIVK
jgi:hypothetical protein